MNIKYLFIDLDGTLTDGRLHYSPNGQLFKSFDVKDGYGIANLLPKNNIEPIIITGGNSLINEKRSNDLGIKRIYQSVNNKLDLILDLVGDELPFVAYIGDDLNDLDIILKVKKKGGLTGCPRDAIDTVIKEVDYVSKHNGGFGAVRDFINWIIAEKNN